MATRRLTTRKQHAVQAREYAEKALENAEKADDECMVAQAQFSAACVAVWQVYVNGGNVEKKEVVEVVLGQRLDELRGFKEVRIQLYEGIAEKYLGFLRGS